MNRTRELKRVTCSRQEMLPWAHVSLATGLMSALGGGRGGGASAHVCRKAFATHPAECGLGRLDGGTAALVGGEVARVHNDLGCAQLAAFFGHACAWRERGSAASAAAGEEAEEEVRRSELLGCSKLERRGAVERLSGCRAGLSKQVA